MLIDPKILWTRDLILILRIIGTISNILQPTSNFANQSQKFQLVPKHDDRERQFVEMHITSLPFLYYLSRSHKQAYQD